MSISQVEDLREREAGTCSTNNRKARGDYGCFHKNMLIKVLCTLERECSNMGKQGSVLYKSVFQTQ